MSTLSPAQEERVGRAIEWALTETRPPRQDVRGWRTSFPGDGERGVEESGRVSVSAPRRYQLCVFCGAPGSRLCCDCDDLPALDYGT